MLSYTRITTWEDSAVERLFIARIHRGNHQVEMHLMTSSHTAGVRRSAFI